ncbi:DNA polymerase III epsilon subunit domain protein [Mycobacterium kansasii]|uniref:DNA polymerase III epsilon subunit domain protein n=1 Tax=Mycobacterium kansasii TaxID=1768 RepID=A0A1V3WZR3_MYCKA|nr:DNA polymerase III epsilon subunit domain protein [Mycobacterium kansasii]
MPLPNVTAMGASGGTQLSLAGLDPLAFPGLDPAGAPADELPLRETTFVVVDLETTGGRTTGTEAARRTPSPRSGRSRCAVGPSSPSSPRWWTRSAASRPRSCS